MEYDHQTDMEQDVELDEHQPSRYKVLLHNDDYTTMDFVVRILVEIFHKSSAEAVMIMLSVHHNGTGLCGVYPREIAETKVHAVHQRARDAGYPLRASMERE